MFLASIVYFLAVTVQPSALLAENEVNVGAQSSGMGSQKTTITGHGSIRTLHEAALKGNIEVVEFLMRSGAGPNDQDEGGLTPLHWAIFGENKSGGKRTDEYVAVIEMLLTKVQKPNNLPKITPKTLFELQNTTLGLAAKGCADRIVALLSKAGANPNFRGAFTPFRKHHGLGALRV